jgi:hypothetical protein
MGDTMLLVVRKVAGCHDIPVAKARQMAGD